MSEQFENNLENNEITKVKRSKKGLIIALAVIVVLGVALAFSWKSLYNFAIKVVKSPSEYYAYLEKKNLENATDIFYDILDEYENEDEQGLEYSLNLGTGEGLSKLLTLEEIRGDTLDWIKSLELVGKVNASKDNTHGDLQAVLNDKDICDLSFLMDSEKGAVYLAFPLLTGEKYVKVDLEEIMGQYGASSDIDDDFKEKLPEEEIVKKLLLKYFDTLTSNLGEAKESKDELTIGNVTQKLTLITYEIDVYEFYNMQKILLEEALGDDELKNAIEKLEDKDVISKGTYITLEKACKDYIERVEFVLEALEVKTEAELSIGAMEYNVWINSKGEIVARSFKSDGSKLFVGTVKDGRKFAEEALVMSNGQEILRVVGEGKISLGKISAEYRAYLNKKDLFAIEADNVKIELNGEIRGKFTLSFGEDMTEYFPGYMYSAKRFVEVGKLVLDVKKNEFILSAEIDGKTAVTLTASGKNKGYEKPSYPSDDKVVSLNDSEALAEMLEGFDLDSVLERLKNAGVPANFLESIMNGTFEEDFKIEESSEEVSEEPEISEESSEVSEEITNVFDITIWIPNEYGADDFVIERIETFCKANPDIIINPTIKCVNEAEVGEMILKNPTESADIFFFLQEDGEILRRSELLTRPVESIAGRDYYGVDACFGEDSSHHEGFISAYPMSIVDGYFMYYDKSLFTTQEARSLESILKTCEEKNLKIRFDLDDPRYLASFFFGTNCDMEWTIDNSGYIISVNETFCSYNGALAMQAMQNLVKSSAYDSNAGIFTDSAVVIGGPELEAEAKKYFGESFSASKLPRFTVDGKSYQLGSFSTHRYVGVKPQENARRKEVLSSLASFLTNAGSQMAAYEKLGWCPTNVEAQGIDGVKNNPTLKALIEQCKVSTAEVHIPQGWSDVAKVLCDAIKTDKDEKELKKVLESYSDELTRLLLVDKSERVFYVVVNGKEEHMMLGNSKGYEWGTPLLTLKKGDVIRIRQGKTWDVCFDKDINGNDLVIEKDGYCTISLYWKTAKQGIVEIKYK